MPGIHKNAETFTTGARTLAQASFVSPEIFATERERIFYTRWLCVGHQSQIARAGDYFVQEVVGESLILLRDQNGEIRGYYNVCRHRGTRLCERDSGQLGETIRCPYHGWKYGLDGRLLGAPHMDKVDGFDKAAHSLHRVNLAV